MLESCGSNVGKKKLHVKGMETVSKTGIRSQRGTRGLITARLSLVWLMEL